LNFESKDGYLQLSIRIPDTNEGRDQRRYTSAKLTINPTLSSRGELVASGARELVVESDAFRDEDD
jgi:hypothetical protein